MNCILEELIRTGVSPTPDGGTVPLQLNVRADEADFLASVVRDLKPVRTLEVGLAMGCSALAICNAIADTPGIGGPCVVLRKTAPDSRRYDHHVEF